MEARKKPPQPAAARARPLDEKELDQVAGGKRSEVKDAHDKHANADTF